jgi:MFS family permease
VAAVTVVFFALGAVSASWAARIPAIKQPLDLSAGQLGLALLGPALGAVVAMPLAGALFTRVPPRPVVLAAFVPLTVLVPLVTVAGNTAELFAVLLGWGAAVGVIDVGMNLEAAEVQRRLGRRIMSRFHACYSIGGLTGAGVGAACAAIGVGAPAQLWAVSGVVLAAGLPAAWRFESRPPRAPALSQDKVPPRLRLSWVLVALAAMAFASFLAEGAANDWSAVYLHGSLGATSGVAALGYTLFATTMAAGRLFGDRAAERAGPTRTVRAAAALGAAGFAVALVVAAPAAALVGLALLGFGLASVVPNVFSAAAHMDRPGPSLSVVTSCGYAGMLAGPPAIGGLADAVGLSTSLILLPVLVLAIAALAGALAGRRP